MTLYIYARDEDANGEVLYSMTRNPGDLPAKLKQLDMAKAIMEVLYSQNISNEQVVVGQISSSTGMIEPKKPQAKVVVRGKEGEEYLASESDGTTLNNLGSLTTFEKSWSKATALRVADRSKVKTKT